MAAVALLAAAGAVTRPPGPYRLPPAPGAPLANDAFAGRVTFSFDDGPDVNTGQVIAELNALHLHGATRPARGADRAGPMIKEARDEHDRAQAREGPAAPLAGQAPTGASGPRRHPPADRVRVPRRCHG